MLREMTGPAAGEAPARDGSADDPMLPDYGGACLSEVVPALLRRAEPGSTRPTWLPELAWQAPQVALLVLDGLGWEQLTERRSSAPTLLAMAGGPITSVAPTTTATALTSLATGLAPATHGIVGYRIALDGDILNVLKWATGAGDARAAIPPTTFQHYEPFLGRRCPVVSRAEFAGTGFTEAHLHGAPLVGWRVVSSLPVAVGRLLRAGERFVYAYYDGIDKVAHDTGLDDRYDAELRAVDRLVGDILAALPEGAVLVVTADHGQVEVRSAPIVLGADVAGCVARLSGEGRFRWLHVASGSLDAVTEACRETYGSLAWVRTREQILDEGWLGPSCAPGVEERLGDLALVARAAVAFFDPSDTGELRLVSRHGSLTSAEMLVPLVAGQP
jgi:predicted AlkP superfamily pyrophosphatase or phosphodiesterase